MAWYAKAKGGYNYTTVEGQSNATEMYFMCQDNGWSAPSICAMLGNVMGEGGGNPWRWEADNVPTYAQFVEWSSSAPMQHGYGLFGFTPAKSYINSTNASKYGSIGYGPNFSDQPGKSSDGAAQTQYFLDTVRSNWGSGLYNYYKTQFANIGVNIDDFYYITFDEFIAGKSSSGEAYTFEQLVGAFELKYEKPNNVSAANSYAHRLTMCKKWADYFNSNPPGPQPSKTKKLPIWFYLKRRTW